MLAGPSDPYELIGTIQIICCYHFTAHSASWSLATECYPFVCSVPAILEVLQLFAAATWASIPLAIRSATEDDLRLTLRRSHCHWHANLSGGYGQPKRHCHWSYTMPARIVQLHGSSHCRLAPAYDFHAPRRQCGPFYSLLREITRCTGYHCDLAPQAGVLGSLLSALRPLLQLDLYKRL